MSKCTRQISVYFILSVTWNQSLKLGKHSRVAPMVLRANSHRCWEWSRKGHLAAASTSARRAHPSKLRTKCLHVSTSPCSCFIRKCISVCIHNRIARFDSFLAADPDRPLHTDPLPWCCPDWFWGSKLRCIHLPFVAWSGFSFLYPMINVHQCKAED